VRGKARARTSVTGAALAVVLAGGAVACSGSAQDGASGDGDDSGRAASTAQAAQPGRYHTLPEPCGAVDRDTLAQLFPGVDPGRAGGDGGDGVSAAPSDSPYGGEPDLTYDTDRRVGCTWQHDTSLGSRRLSVDFERVVSYDPTISDDEEATRLFAERADKVGLTAGTDGAPDDTGDEQSAGTGTQAQGTEGTQGDTTDDDPLGAADDSPAPDASGSPGTEPTPRLLDGIGDAAYLDDDLSGDDDSARRTVTLVFRTANVLVTVEYTEAMTDGHRTPAAAELEGKAQDLAGKLVGRFDDI
jgi:hypothetical protein